MPIWVLSERHKYALCLMPKVASSELLQLVRWQDLTSKEFCGHHNSHFLNMNAVEDKCTVAAVGATANANAQFCHVSPSSRPSSQGKSRCASQYDELVVPRFRIADVTDTTCPGRLSPLACKHRLVVVRAPWERLISGLANKLGFLTKVAADETGSGQNWLPMLGMFNNASRPLLDRLLLALLAAPDGPKTNAHFRSQSELCLATREAWTYVALLEERVSSSAGNSLDGLAQHLSNSSYMPSAILYNGSYSSAQVCFACGGSTRPLIEQLRDRRFDRDLAVLRDLGIGDFSSSFNRAIELCETEGQACHAGYRNTHKISKICPSAARPAATAAAHEDHPKGKSVKV